MPLWYLVNTYMDFGRAFFEITVSVVTVTKSLNKTIKSGTEIMRFRLYK